MAVAKKNISWMLPLAGIAILSAHVLILHYLDLLGWEPTLKDSLYNSAVITLAIWGIILLIQRYPTRVGIITYALVIGAATGGLLSYVNWQVLKWWLDDDHLYTAWLNDTIPLRLSFNCIVLCWVATYSAMKKRADTLEAKFAKHNDASILLRDAELFKLRQQLQPHFLYNSLNSISALVMIQPDKAQEMIGRLSDFLRSSVKREAQDLIPIAEELDFIEAYLSIEAIRFGDRLKVKVEKEYTDDATIPPFLLQPLLENAIKFGLYGKTGSVEISVHIALAEQILAVKITNPYDPQGLPPKGTGWGLEGIRRRMELLYARTDLLEVKKDENYFTTTLKIPQ